MVGGKLDRFDATQHEFSRWKRWKHAARRAVVIHRWRRREVAHRRGTRTGPLSTRWSITTRWRITTRRSIAMRWGITTRWRVAHAAAATQSAGVLAVGARSWLGTTNAREFRILRAVRPDRAGRVSHASMPDCTRKPIASTKPASSTPLNIIRKPMARQSPLARIAAVDCARRRGMQRPNTTGVRRVAR